MGIEWGIDQDLLPVEMSMYVLGKTASFLRYKDDAGRIRHQKLPNGVTTDIQYDRSSRPVAYYSYLGGGSHKLTYRYTATGNISIINEEFNNLIKPHRYEYDNAGRLVREDSIKSAVYNLDLVGNDSSRGGTFNELNQLVEDATFTYQYNLNGNLTKKTSKLTGDHFVYSWNAEGQLMEVKIFKNGPILSKSLVYKYDALGRRIIRAVDDHLSPSKSYGYKYIYDGAHILAILDLNDKFLAGYLYGAGVDDPVAMVTDYNGDGELDVLSIMKDHLNSVKFILNEEQEIVEEVNYSAYGETQILNRGQSKSKTNNIFYYTSRELERETGDYYYRARYYDPGSGRFLSEDPIGFAGRDINLYRYVVNNPVLFRDPQGTIAPVLIWVIGIGIGIILPPDLIAPEEVYDPNKGRVEPPNPYPKDNFDKESRLR